jgi:hypothetical protein
MKTYTEIEKLADEVYPTTDMGKLKSNIGFIKGYNQCQEDMADKKYTEEDMLKAIEKARDIFDGKDCFTAEDVSGCTEVCTYNWKFQFSEDDIINSLNK